MSSSKDTQVKPHDLRNVFLHFRDHTAASDFNRHWFVNNLRDWKRIGDYYRAFRILPLEESWSYIKLEYSENEKYNMPQLANVHQAMADEIMRHLKYWGTQAGMELKLRDEVGVHFNTTA